MAKKYIDADKLIANLERQNVDKKVIEPVIRIINSLQQEQPAKRGYKDCNGCEYNRPLKDQIGWQFRGCFGGDYKGKPIAEIELCPLKVVQQEQPCDTCTNDKGCVTCKDGELWEGKEQPCEDLNDEIKKFIEEYGYERGNDKLLIAIVARHFANWQKEQMLKDAVERTVKIDSGGYPYIDITAELYDYEHDVPLAKEGELVKIVIVKEDKE